MLASLAVIGGISSYTDFTKGIIPNRILLAGLITGALLHLAFLLFGAIDYYLQWLLNMVIADLQAFVLYMGKLWAAGDAKLFMVLYWLTPPILLDGTNFEQAIVPYICIFIPALFWVIIDSIYRFINKSPVKMTKHVNLKDTIISFVVVFLEATAFYVIISLLFSSFTRANEMFVTLLIMIYAYLCSTCRVMKKWYVISLHGAIFILFLILNHWQFGILRWLNFLILLLVIIFQSFVSRYNYKQIAPSEVQKNMILSADTVIAFRKSRIQSLPMDYSEEITAKITEQEAQAVKRWAKSKNGTEYIWIVRKIPFAIMIETGFIMWMIIRIVR